jgi:hypothetical protein
VSTGVLLPLGCRHSQPVAVAVNDHVNVNVNDHVNERDETAIRRRSW